jgi:SAM-dependent methyltransferase
MVIKRHPFLMNMNPRYYMKHMENIDLLGPIPSGQLSYALDLGCGRGGDSEYLRSLGFKVDSVDIEKHYEKAIACDIRSYPITAGKYSIIICNNVLPFIADKNEVKDIISNILHGLAYKGSAFLTLYGLKSGFAGRTDMSFFGYDEIRTFLETLPVQLTDSTTTEGFTKNGKGEIIYQHSHRFIVTRR